MKRTYLLYIISVCLIIGLIGIFSIMSVMKTPTGGVIGEPALAKISIGDNMIPGSAPLAVAYYNDYFKEEGLDLTIEKFTAGRFSFDAMLTGDVDIADVAETPLMFYRFQGDDIYVIGTMTSYNKGMKVVARKDQGILTPLDLENKRIGILKGTTSEYYMGAFLKKYGIDESEVILVNLKPPEMVTSLVRGDIDAFGVWEPFIYKAKKELGNNVIVFADEDVYTGTWNFAVKKEFAEKNPETLKKFLRAMVKAEEFMDSNKEESFVITADYTGLEPKVVEGIWEDFMFDITLSPELLEYLEKEAEWAKEKGLLPEDSEIPDYNSMIYSNLLREIKPEAVTVS